MKKTSIFFSTLLISGVTLLPIASQAEQKTSCGSVPTDTACLEELAKKVISTGEELKLGLDIIDLAKALQILEKLGIKIQTNDNKKVY